MSFAAPELLWWLAMAPAAVLLAALLWRRWHRAAARWVEPALWPRLMPGHRPRRVTASVLCLGLVVVGLVLALARPQGGAAPEAPAAVSGDVVLALDSSLSMAASDVAPSRFDVARLLLRHLVAELPGHRLALVQWEAEPVVLAPLTTDHALIRSLAAGVQPASLARPGSDLGRALDTALDLLPPEGGAVVLLTDGEDHGTALESRAQTLAAAGVRVFALGLGTLGGSTIDLGAAKLKRDASGQVVVTRLVEEPLELLATRTGGVYLQASRADTSLAPVSTALATRSQGPATRTDTLGGEEPPAGTGEAFAWPLLLAIGALGAHLLLLEGGAPRRGRWSFFPARRGLPRLVNLMTLVGLLGLQGTAGAPPRSGGTAVPWWLSERVLAGRTADALAAGDVETAVATALGALERHPDEPLLAYNAGTAPLAADDAEALALLRRSGEDATASLAADARYNLGLAHLARGETTAALAAFEGALRAEPGHKAARFNLEWLLRRPSTPPDETPPAPPPTGAAPPPGLPPPPASLGSTTPEPGAADPPTKRFDRNQIEALLRSVEDLERRQHEQASHPAERSTGARDW